MGDGAKQREAQGTQGQSDGAGERGEGRQGGGEEGKGGKRRGEEGIVPPRVGRRDSLGSGQLCLSHGKTKNE